MMMSQDAKLGILVGGGPAPGINSVIGAATIRAEVIEVMARQVNDIKLDRITTSFDPRSVLYEPETDKVFVHGVQTSQGPGGRPQGRNRTYEFRIAFANYRPRITHIDVYGGEPKTLDRLQNQPGGAEEQ